MCHFLRGILRCAFAGVLFLSFQHAASAEKVMSAEPDNIFLLEEGRPVRLAGLIIPEESANLISILLAGKEIKLRVDGILGDKDDHLHPHPVYIYVDTSELSFPFADAANTHQQKVVVNELLLGMGAAYVDQKLEFEMKERFLEIEAEAKLLGKGIWSYEEIPQS